MSSSSTAMTAANRTLLQSYLTLLVGIVFYASAAAAGPIVARNPEAEANAMPEAMPEAMADHILEQRSKAGEGFKKFLGAVTSCEIM